MGLGQQKTEGGSGGKRGHSNVTHWDHFSYELFSDPVFYQPTWPGFNAFEEV